MEISSFDLRFLRWSRMEWIFSHVFRSEIKESDEIAYDSLGKILKLKELKIQNI
jgi:hypothetical protein